MRKKSITFAIKALLCVGADCRVFYHLHTGQPRRNDRTTDRNAQESGEGFDATFRSNNIKKEIVWML